jgi:hypothetical protein
VGGLLDLTSASIVEDYYAAIAFAREWMDVKFPPKGDETVGAQRSITK